jgi:hypothetical protein
MYELWKVDDLKALLQKLGAAFAGTRLEIEHNGERVRYASKYELRMAAVEVAKELRRRGELPREKPARVLYTYKTGAP